MKLLLICVIFGTLFALKSNAECTVNWKPGDLTVVEAGHDVLFVVEKEDVDAFKNQKTLDERLLPLPPMDNKFDEAIKSLAHTHYCGDYREVEDADLE